MSSPFIFFKNESTVPTSESSSVCIFPYYQLSFLKPNKGDTIKKISIRSIKIIEQHKVCTNVP